MIHYLYSKDGFTYVHSVQYKMLLFVYIYIDLLKLTAYKLFENSDADLSWLLFLKKPTFLDIHGLRMVMSSFFSQLGQQFCSLFEQRTRTFLTEFVSKVYIRSKINK